MATRFWVGGSGNWDAATTTHWSATTGGAGGASVPTSVDDVTFDANSGAAATVTITAAANANSITINKSDITLLHNAGSTVAGTVAFMAGTLNTNGQTCSWGAFTMTTAGAKTLTMGASQITIINSNGIGSSGTAPTVTVNTATWFIQGAGSSMCFVYPIDWKGLSLSITGGGQYSTVGAVGAATFKNVTRVGAATKTDTFQIASPMIVTGTLTIGGNTTQGANRLLLFTATPGVARTLTVGAVVITGDVDFMDINIAYSGAPSWTNAGSAFIGDALGNSGITFTPAVTRFWVLDGGNWSSTGHWSATSGGASGASVPLPQDTARFDANSFTLNTQTVTMDMPRLCKDLDETGLSKTAQLVNGALVVSLYGSLLLAAAGAGWSNSSTIRLTGRGSHTITTNAKSIGFTVNVNGPGGTYTQLDSLVFSGALSITAGTYVCNGFTCTWSTQIALTGSALFTVAFDATGGGNVTAGTSGFSTTGVCTISLGSGTWTLSGTGTVWSVAAGAVLIPGTAIIDITNTTATARTFAGGGLSYPTLRYRATGSAGLTITGNNTFVGFDVEDTTARTLTLPAGGTQTVTGAITLQGAAGQLLSLVSSSPGTPTTLRATGATPSVSYATLSISADVVLITTVGTSCTLPYTLLTVVGTSRGLPYGLQTAVGGSRALPYGLRAIAGSSRTLPYGLRTVVGSSRAFPYGLRTLAGASRSLPATVIGQVGASRALPYSSRSFAGKSVAFPYSQTGAVGRSLVLKWRVRRLAKRGFAIVADPTRMIRVAPHRTRANVYVGE